jgi:hypothetical protein
LSSSSSSAAAISATSCPLLYFLCDDINFGLFYRWHASKLCQQTEMHEAELLSALASCRYIQSLLAISTSI